MAEQATEALRLGLDLFSQSSAKASASHGTPSAAAAAVRQLYELVDSDEQRLEVLGQASSLAGCAHMKNAYPDVEAHWLVAKAHNAACSAQSMRQRGVAQAYMQAAMRVADATACKALGAASLKRTLKQWGAET